MIIQISCWSINNTYQGKKGSIICKELNVKIQIKNNTGPRMDP